MISLLHGLWCGCVTEAGVIKSNSSEKEGVSAAFSGAFHAVCGSKCPSVQPQHCDVGDQHCP